ncbi:unnamed protein product [Prunus armeniaca]|uniref:Uncharacterized protein n=1 Tax=Prunus armeniaca TaxID=36596 RepID=A0A6J5XUA9_PRUAR|nr:unnamed protein product [Prunus armeniaca]
MYVVCTELDHALVLIQSQTENTRLQPPPTILMTILIPTMTMAKVTAKRQKKAFSGGESIGGSTVEKASSFFFWRRSNR